MTRQPRIATAGLLLLLFGLIPRAASPYSDGPPPGYSGAPGDATCVACHDSYALNEGAGGVGFSQFVTSYAPGETHNIQVVTGLTDFHRWGFQLTLVDGAGDGAGILLPDTLGQVVIADNPPPQRDYAGQNAAGMQPGSPYGQWPVTYIGPPQGTGTVTFHVVGLAADGDGTPAGDYVYSFELTASEGAPPDSIVPQPIYLTLMEHDFGLTPLGSSRTVTSTLYNTGPDPLEITGWDWAYGYYFTREQPPGPLTIPSTGSTAITVRFSPELTGSWGDTLRFFTTGGGDARTAMIPHGYGTLPLPPDSFHLAAPGDGATVYGDSIRFRWTASANRDSVDPQPVYTLQIDTESDFPAPLEYDPGADTSLAVPGADLSDQALYFWRVYAHDSNTPGRFSSEEWAFMTDFTAVEEEETARPASPLLVDTWPNPFNDRVAVTITLARPAPVTVELYSVDGRRVARLQHGPLAAGEHRLAWDGKQAASGVYWLRVDAGPGGEVVRKLVLLR